MLIPLLATDYPGGASAILAGMLWLIAWPSGSLATLFALPASLFLRPFHPFTRVTSWIAVAGTFAAGLCFLIAFATTAHDLLQEYPYDSSVIHRLMADFRTWGILTAVSVPLACLAFGIRYRRCRDCPLDAT